MLYSSESGGFMQDLVAIVPGGKQALGVIEGAKPTNTIDCGGGKEFVYKKGTMSPLDALYCGCKGQKIDGKLYGLGGAWPCPPSLGGTGSTFIDDQPTTDPSDPGALDAAADQAVADAIAAAEKAAGISSKKKKKTTSAPFGTTAPKHAAVYTPTPALPWWVWLVAAGAGAWLLFGRRR